MAIQNPNIVIAVMGMTGAGKSSFISRVTGDESVKVGNKLHSGKSNPFRKSPNVSSLTVLQRLKKLNHTSTIMAAKTSS
jgi:ABC-type hemin transport system ATPase subunit